MAHIEKRGPGNYRVRYRGPDKKERSKTFKKKSKAEHFRSSVETDINRSLWVAPERKRTMATKTVANALQEAKRRELAAPLGRGRKGWLLTAKSRKIKKQMGDK